MTKDEMAKLLRQAERVSQLERELSTARRQLRRDLQNAHHAGASVSELARQLQLSRTRIKQLLDEPI